LLLMSTAPGARSAVLVTKRGLRRVRRRPGRQGGVGLVAPAAARDSETATKTQAHDSW
jgi:hypothetical protein